jgi:hypothetical protein
MNPTNEKSTAPTTETRPKLDLSRPLSIFPITLIATSTSKERYISNKLPLRRTMKLIKRNISAKDGSGTIMLCPNTPEDLWHAYNLLQKGDLVRCTTVRKVVKESSTGSTTSSKKRLMLTIEMKRVDFDPDALQVRLSGKVQSENDFVRMGAHHT